MAIFGRRTARQRLRSAARQSLATPAFTVPADCTEVVLGGLWPAELATITAETAPLAEYLHADLRRITQSANEKLHAIHRSGLPDGEQEAARRRVVNVARAFAVLRVESTVRQLRRETLEFGIGYPGMNGAPLPGAPVPQADQVASGTGVASGPEVASGTEVASNAGLGYAAEAMPTADAARPAEAPEPVQVADPAQLPAAGPEVESEPPVEVESSQQRLRRLLEFAARQEPALHWAIGTCDDGRPILVTDLASGWIPPGVAVPAGVRLLEPGRRDGRVTALLGTATCAASYRPGDRLGRASDAVATVASIAPRALPAIDDLGWVLTGVTHWREGLPRLVNTVAKAGAAGTGVAEAELDLLRVHLDTLRYQLIAGYPNLDIPALLNCMLLAATDAIATGDRISANYHFAWFRALSTAVVDDWS